MMIVELEGSWQGKIVYGGVQACRLPLQSREMVG